jgi:hypothetical protein
VTSFEYFDLRRRLAGGSRVRIPAQDRTTHVIRTNLFTEVLPPPEAARYMCMLVCMLELQNCICQFGVVNIKIVPYGSLTYRW